MREAGLVKRRSRAPDAQQTEGQEAIWHIRSGNYRIAYTVHRNVLRILVLRIGDRKDFYRHFNR